MRLFNPINYEDEQFFKFENTPKTDPTFKDKVDKELEYI